MRSWYVYFKQCYVIASKTFPGTVVSVVITLIKLSTSDDVYAHMINRRVYYYPPTQPIWLKNKKIYNNNRNCIATHEYWPLDTILVKLFMFIGEFLIIITHHTFYRYRSRPSVGRSPLPDPGRCRLRLPRRLSLHPIAALCGGGGSSVHHHTAEWAHRSSGGHRAVDHQSVWLGESIDICYDTLFCTLKNDRDVTVGAPKDKRCIRYEQKRSKDWSLWHTTRYVDPKLYHYMRHIAFCLMSKFW